MHNSRPSSQGRPGNGWPKSQATSRPGEFAFKITMYIQVSLEAYICCHALPFRTTRHCTATPACITAVLTQFWAKSGAQDRSYVNYGVCYKALDLSQSTGSLMHPGRNVCLGLSYNWIDFRGIGISAHASTATARNACGSLLRAYRHVLSGPGSCCCLLVSPLGEH